jgi:replicative DNA helicase
MMQSLPHSLEAEQAVLAAVVLDNVALDTVSTILAPEDFYLQSHRMIFAASLAIYRENRPVDMLTLTDKLLAANRLEAAGGPAAISALAGRISTAANVGYWAAIVKEKSILRHIIQFAGEASSEAYGEPESAADLLNTLQGKLESLMALRDRGGMVPIVQPYSEMFDWLHGHKDRPAFSGLRTGWPEIDAMILGMERGDLIYLAARTSMGKTAFALNLLYNICFRDNRVAAFFSLEMRKGKIVRRLMGLENDISLDNLINCSLTDSEWNGLVPAGNEFKRARLFISDARRLTVPDMRAACRRLKREQGKLDLVVIDQLSFIRNHVRDHFKLSKAEQLAEISRELKDTAEDLDVPLVCLHQLNRELFQRKDPTPFISDMKASGSMEEDADMVWLLHRPGYFKKDYHDPRELQFILAKARDRKLGMAPLTFVESKGRMESRIIL